MDIRPVGIEQLNMAPYNPRIDLQPGHPDYEKLKRSIEEFGYVEPIVWNERTGNVVGGHQRLKILLAEGRTEVDVSVVDIDEDEEKVLNLALNRISGDWDMDKLPFVLRELQSADIDILLSGFEPYEIDLYTLDENVYGTEEKLNDSYKEPEKKRIRCPSCGHVDDKERFVSA